MAQTEWLAMILSGGKGARLGTLTDYMAKPAVHFGGIYRIIDFTLSNCANSGIHTAGVLTQYRSEELHHYIADSRAWNTEKEGGLFMLPSSEVGASYSGTADAIYKNMEFIDRLNPTHVLVLSGDHIYKMDYRKMLAFHKETDADATIAVKPVLWEDAPRFGIMSVDGNGLVTEFAEKPEEPKSSLASMGIYIFKWEKLKKYLTDDENKENSDHDFGKNIIPAALTGGGRLCAYPFGGYWRDVGTVLSLWEANMELLRANPEIDINDEYWRMFLKHAPAITYIPHRLNIKNSLVAEGCDIYGRVENSIVCKGVTVADGALVVDSVLMPGAAIGRNARISKALIGERATVSENANIGTNFGCDMYCDNTICANGVSLVGPGVYVAGNMKISKNSHVIAWNDSLKLGNETIDCQHKKMFDMADELIGACLAGSAAEKLRELLNFLSEYIGNHCGNEENLLLRYGYPGYGEHKQLHEDLIFIIGVLQYKFSENESSEKLAGDITNVLVRMITEHIRHEDKRIARFIGGY
jgi:glucose-1-phosphate adenylyltransferase